MLKEEINKIYYGGNYPFLMLTNSNQHTFIKNLEYIHGVSVIK